MVGGGCGDCDRMVLICWGVSERDCGKEGLRGRGKGGGVERGGGGGEERGRGGRGEGDINSAERLGHFP